MIDQYSQRRNLLVVVDSLVEAADKVGEEVPAVKRGAEDLGALGPFGPGIGSRGVSGVTLATMTGAASACGVKSIIVLCVILVHEMSLSGIDFIVLLNLGVIHVGIAALIYRYRHRLSGRTNQDPTPVPERPDQWRDAVNDAISEIESVVAERKDGVDAGPAHELVSPDARLRRLGRNPPAAVDDEVARRLHRLEVACRDASIGNTVPTVGSGRADRIDEYCTALKQRLEANGASANE